MKKAHIADTFYPPLRKNKSGYVAINNCFVSTDSGLMTLTLTEYEIT